MVERTDASAHDLPSGALGPTLAILVAVALGGLLLARFGDAGVTAAESRAALGLAELAARAPGPSPLDAQPALPPGVRLAWIEDVAAPEPGFVRELVDRSRPEAPRLDPRVAKDKALIDAYHAARLGERATFELPSGLRAAVWRAGVDRSGRDQGQRGAVVVVDLPASPPWGFWSAMALTAALAGLALLGWRRAIGRRVGRGPAAAGAALGAVGVLAGLTWGVSRVAAAMSAVAARFPLPDAGGATADALHLVDAALVLGAAVAPVVLLGAAGISASGRRSPHRVAYGYIAPAIGGLAALILVPFAIGLWMAFTRYADGEFTWIGLQNFAQILGSDGYRITHPLSFWFTLVVTILWTGLNVALHAAIGLGLALILREPTLGLRGVYRVLLIIPWAVPNYITALVWKGMFNKQYGLINHLLGWMGVEPVSWFSSFWSAFAANVTTNTWLGFPFMMVVSLGALQSIPRDLYEAADVDGASRWQQLRNITIPLLKPALFPAIIVGSIWTFNMFNIIYLVSGGQPDGSTDILITEAYRWAFEQDRYGYAAAYSVLIFLILLGYSLFTQRITRSGEGAFD